MTDVYLLLTFFNFLYNDRFSADWFKSCHSRIGGEQWFGMRF